MTGGIRAEVSLSDAPGCPLSSIVRADATVYSIARSPSGNDPEAVVFEFVVEEGAIDTDGFDVAAIFDYGDQTAYRVEVPRDDRSPFEIVERHGVPIVETSIREGRLFLTFHATDLPVLRSILGSLEEATNDLSVHRLLQSTADPTGTDIARIDRSQLTDRQREVLQTAYDRGYFAYPKEANAGEVAAALDIDQSTFAEHLAAAQRKLLSSILD